MGYSDTYKPDGSEGKPYIISSHEGGDMFCNVLNNAAWNNFEGKTVKLDGDIATVNMAERFKGTFDGDGHTIEVTYAPTQSQTTPAPFRNVEGTTAVKNLHVDGTITNSGFYAAGFIANQSETTTIENCRVSITIEENGNTTLGKMSEHGGFVAKANGTVNITGCVFNGKMLGSSAWGCGDFVGLNNGTVNISASLFAPSEITITTTRTENDPFSGQVCATFSRVNYSAYRGWSFLILRGLRKRLTSSPKAFRTSRPDSLRTVGTTLIFILLSEFLLFLLFNKKIISQLT